MKKYEIPRWKLPIIRWALRQLKPLLPALYQATFEEITKFGVSDFHVNDFTNEIAIYLD